MKRYYRIRPQCLVVCVQALFLFGFTSQAEARGGGIRSGGGGRSVSRPAPRPSTNAGSRPNGSTGSRVATRPASVSNLPVRNPGSALDRSPGISAGSEVARAAAMRPMPTVRPTTKFAPAPAALRAGLPAQRYTAARATTRAAFAVPRAAAAPARTAALAQRTRMAATVRTAVAPRAAVLYSPSWWAARTAVWGSHRWHYCHGHPPAYWWRRSAWAAVAGWVAYGYTDPWFYDYDDNIVFQDDTVYINEEPVAAAEDYIEIGNDLAEARPLGDAEQPEWLPLGVFAIATSASDTTPQMTVQMVLSKDGRISGTYYHWSTQNTRLISGTVDQQTQRVAFHIGEERSNVVEVGLAGLAEELTPMWVHFGTKQTQTWTLIRLEAPESVQKEWEQEPGPK